MVKVTLMTGIQSMSGTLNKKSNTRIVFTTRKAPSKNKGVTRMYIRSADSYKRSTPPTEKELEARRRFAWCSEWVAIRREEGDNRSLKELWKDAKERYNRLNDE